MSATDDVTPEELQPKAPVNKKNLITIMVLSITLAQVILGKKAPKGGKLAPGQGKIVVKAIEKAVKANFPDMAQMILGLFGLEMINLMPMLSNPDRVVAEMMEEYADTIAHVTANSKPNMV